jgi:probable rRNA maturation factor
MPTPLQRDSKIAVRNSQRKTRVDVVTLQAFAEHALAQSLRIGSGTNLLRQILILLISDHRMASLHRRFMNKSGSTDVITFQHGEIFISVPTAKRQARQFGNSLVQEIQLYIAHGLLHLRGFDDRTKADARKMRMAERKILGSAPGFRPRGRRRKRLK